MIDQTLRAELLAMAECDQSVRARLLEGGALFQGYNPEMAHVHRENGARLQHLMDVHGWPGESLVGQDGAWAAWLIAVHAISQPALMRRALVSFKKAVAQGDASARQAAVLEDTIRFHEGRPQVYGTVFDWNTDGVLGIYPSVEDPGSIDNRRSEVGLPPLAEAIAIQRKAARESGEKPPSDLARRRQEQEAWARSVGWRDGAQ